MDNKLKGENMKPKSDSSTGVIKAGQKAQEEAGSGKETLQGKMAEGQKGGGTSQPKK
jgi:hypothetical protein